jgi:5-amino-6-(5-phosphoribosylamino)uracil reductase/diaminohydroxyphosphoribosylaminopyrimidine deaminase/5-amino-6-(5-phosphoribosylamino)uracil reductase
VEPTPDGLVSIEETLTALGERGVATLLVEGGSRVLTSFFRARRVHRIEVEISMLVLGAPGTATLGVLGVETLEHAPTLTNVTVDRLGSSVLVRGDVAEKATS